MKVFKFQIGQEVHVYHRDKEGDDSDFHGIVQQRWFHNGYELYIVDGVRTDVSKITER